MSPDRKANIVQNNIPRGKRSVGHFQNNGESVGNQYRENCSRGTGNKQEILLVPDDVFFKIFI